MSNEDTNTWISLPGNQYDGVNEGGACWIGNAYRHDTPIWECRLTDGLSVLSLEEAVAAGWVDGLWDYLDAETQTVRTVGLASLGADDTWLRTTQMYIVESHLDNLALIVPWDAPEPASACTLLVGLPLLVLHARRRRRA